VAYTNVNKRHLIRGENKMNTDHQETLYTMHETINNVNDVSF